MASRKSPRGAEKNLCGGCSKDVFPEDKALMCSICDAWYHIKCERVSIGDYDLLRKSDDSIQWYCKMCKGASQKMFKMITLIHKRQDQIETEVKSLSTAVQGCNERLDTQSKHFETLDQKMSSIGKDLPALISEKVSEILADKQDEEERGNNLMIFNLEEGSEEEEVVHDVGTVKAVCRNVLGIASEDNIEEVCRLGIREKEGVGKPRPLRVKILERKERGTILKNAYKLKNSADMKKVGIGRDLTRKLQRVKNDRPERSWAIRRDKIVEVPARDKTVEVPAGGAAVADAAPHPGD